MGKGYIGTTRYVPSASRLTDDYGYNGDIAYVIDEANKKVSSEWTKYNGHWIKVQTGSSGGGGIPTLEDDIPVTVSAGGIQIGTFYAAGTELETIFRNLLNPVAYPTLTNPSCTISTTSPTIVERGSTVNATIKATFSRTPLQIRTGILLSEKLLMDGLLRALILISISLRVILYIVCKIHSQLMQRVILL